MISPHRGMPIRSHWADTSASFRKSDASTAASSVSGAAPAPARPDPTALRSPDGRYAAVTHNLAHFQVPATQLDRGWLNTSALTVIAVSEQKILGTVTLDEVDRGAATYAHALPEADAEAFLTDPHKGFGEAQNGTGNPSYVEIAAVPSATVTVKRGGEVIGAVRWGEVETNGKAATPRVRVELLDRGRNWVRTTVLDDETGKPVPCRVHFRSPEGIPYQPHGHPDHAHRLAVILQATSRGSDLVRRLLAFSRRQVLRGALAAEHKVAIKMNVPQAQLRIDNTSSITALSATIVIQKITWAPTNANATTKGIKTGLRHIHTPQRLTDRRSITRSVQAAAPTCSRGMYR